MTWPLRPTLPHLSTATQKKISVSDPVCIHFYLISFFHNQYCHFYNIYLIMHHTSSSRCEIYVKSISNKNYEKWRNCLFKMKRLNSKLLLEKGFGKEVPLFEWTLGKFRKVGEAKPPNQKLFLILLIQIKKKEFF